MNTSHVPEWRIITYTWHRGKTQPPAMHWIGARGISVKGVCNALYCSIKTGLHFRFYTFDRYLFMRWHGEDFPVPNTKPLMSPDCHDPHFHHSLAQSFPRFLFTLQLWITSPFSKSGFTYLKRPAVPSAWRILSQCGRGRSITATNDPSPSCLNCLDKSSLAWPATMHFFLIYTLHALYLVTSQVHHERLSTRQGYVHERAWNIHFLLSLCILMNKNCGSLSLDVINHSHENLRFSRNDVKNHSPQV